MPDSLSLDGIMTRRRFIRIALGLPVLAVSAAFPLELLAQGFIPIAAPGGIKPGRKPRAPRLLMIDPGHGGHDPGTISRTGIQEKDVTLDIAKRMVEVFASRRDINAKLTRSDDVFIPLPDRVKICREERADLFVSIHADSAPNTAARGLSAYTLSEKASDAFAKALATQENRIEAMGGVDLGVADKDVAAILMDLTARRTRNASQRVKHEFVRSMGKTWRLLEKPMRSANFAVLRAPDVPSILVETG
ncbi:MAG: N-acetylmuramoyl-L-alanine amidase, partial [Alphaproteobacteria bacterium]|nr:N-acetylmuramoyl-L-alanine amidase [Alphaproteobacteria bacterium]